MLPSVIAIPFALFVWWFSTGAVLWLDGLPRRTFRWSLLGGSAVALAALAGLSVSAADASGTGAFCAFTCAVLAWAWVELSFYTGFVTGPRTHACHPGCSGWRHFGHAIQVSLWHELAILAIGGSFAAITWGEPNRVGLWTFLVLAWMHESARLNVFLGVPNLNEEFLPEHLRYLRSFLRQKPMNLLFPLSITVSMIGAVILAQRALDAEAGGFAATGCTLLATMLGLAIVEHWFLVLPLPSAELWRWALRSRATREPAIARPPPFALATPKTGCADA